MVEKKYKVSKYKNWKKRQSLKTYSPTHRLEVRKEHAVPFFVRVGNIFLVLGGVVSFFVSGLFIGICGFFGFKKTVDDKVSRFKGRKYLEVRIKE